MHPPVALLLHPAAPIALSEFTVHWSTVIGLVGLGALYHRRARQASPSLPESGTPTTGQRALFFTGLALIFLSLNGWVHDLSDYYLFSAHMVQHLVLTLIVAPLLLAGTPGWMLDRLLAPPLRRPLGRGAGRLTRPVPALALYAAALIAWHLPGPFTTALEIHGWRIVEHLVLLATAVLAW